MGCKGLHCRHPLMSCRLPNLEALVRPPLRYGPTISCPKIKGGPDFCNKPLMPNGTIHLTLSKLPRMDASQDEILRVASVLEKIWGFPEIGSHFQHTATLGGSFLSKGAPSSCKIPFEDQVEVS